MHFKMCDVFHQIRYLDDISLIYVSDKHKRWCFMSLVIKVSWKLSLQEACNKRDDNPECLQKEWRTFNINNPWMVMKLCVVKKITLGKFIKQLIRFTVKCCSSTHISTFQLRNVENLCSNAELSVKVLRSTV